MLCGACSAVFGLVHCSVVRCQPGAPQQRPGVPRGLCWAGFGLGWVGALHCGRAFSSGRTSHAGLATTSSRPRPEPARVPFVAGTAEGGGLGGFGGRGEWGGRGDLGGLGGGVGGGSLQVVLTADIKSMKPGSEQRSCAVKSAGGARAGMGGV